MKSGSLQRIGTQRLIFFAVSVLLFIQVGWWVSLQIRQTRLIQEAKIETLRANRAEAWQMDSLKILAFTYQGDILTRSGVIEGKLPELPSLEERRRAIEERFTAVAVVPTPVAPDDPPLLDKAGYLTLRREPLHAMERERRFAIWRSAAEGGFMALGVLLGFVLIYRKLNEEMDLKLRQRNFIAAVTHELKTPIAALRVWTETLFSRALSDEQKSRIHGLMDKDLERLTELVGNVLDVARAESGGFEVFPEALELGPWVKGVCESMDQRLGPGSLGLRLNLAPQVWAMADPKALSTVLENLLSNAYKYAGSPRTTTVTLDQDKDEAILVVADRGVGISAKEVPRLFQRFYRVGDEMTRQVPGTGLGLFLAREIVARHGGDIRITSQGPGLGATVTVRIPRLRRTA